MFWINFFLINLGLMTLVYLTVGAVKVYCDRGFRKYFSEVRERNKVLYSKREHYGVVGRMLFMRIITWPERS